MPELSEDQIRRRRRNAAANLAAGGLMVGGAAAAQEHISNRTGVKSNLAALKDIARTKKITAAHGKHTAGWLGTRGVAAAGVPLAAMGAKNLLAPKPKHTGSLDIKDDVIGESVDRSTPTLKRRDETTRRAKAAQFATVTAGSAAGGVGGAALGRRLAKGRLRLVGVGLGTTAGATGGAIASAPLGRRAVRHTTGGEYDYSTERGVYRRGGVRKSSLPAGQAIKELPQTEQKQLIQRKKKQSKYSLASAGLGLTAFGLKSPALVAAAAKRSKKIGGLKPVQRFASAAPKTDAAATNLGIASLGVGGLGSLNFARIQRAETKADQRATGIKKSVEYSTIRRGAGEGLDPDYDYVEAHHRGKNIGYLKLRQGGEIDHVKVKRSHRRKGIATAMYRRAEEEGLNPRHSTALSRKGKAWKASLSGNRQRSEDVAKALVHKRVLVTGSRDWDDEPEVHRQLDRIASEHPDIEVIEGGARGADTHARNWAKQRGRKVSTYQADWKAHGRAAGPKRNQRMLEEGKPQRVLAFSRDLKNSKGTRDMVRRAERAGVRVDRYGEELAKALIPARMFRPKPLGFGGVRAGGIRRTPTGRLVTYRGSMG